MKWGRSLVLQVVSNEALRECTLARLVQGFARDVGNRIGHTEETRHASALRRLVGANGVATKSKDL